MIKLTALLHLFFLPILSFCIVTEADYQLYHQKVIKAENSIALENYKEALTIYEYLFENYEFIFLREYQIATQLAWQLDEKPKALSYLKKGILAGWTLKSIKRNKFLSPLRKTDEWKVIKKGYRSWHKQFEFSLHDGLIATVRKMYKKDQRKAFLALFTLSSKAQDRYAENKFAPHSEKQMQLLRKILDKIGYPGEQMVGNNYWTSTIISHHNSISKNYNQNDSLYLQMKPILLKAIHEGQLSPFEFMIIDEWYNSTIDKNKGYGVLNPPYKSDLDQTNDRRSSIGIRSIELRNSLIDIQEETTLNLYLGGSPWVNGKIIAKDE